MDSNANFDNLPVVKNSSGGRQRPKPSPRLAPGMLIQHDRYLIEKVIALGGMGAVYAAIDQHLRRPCAVKEMLDTFTEPQEKLQAVEWFEREASLLHDLNHTAIPRVRDYFCEESRYYLVMDFVTGSNLAEILDKEGKPGLSEDRVRNWAMQICDVLSYLHHQNVVFRDLKPANIMVGPDERIKLIDFGIARNLRAQNETTVIVTYGFSAPEQMQGRPEPRSDIYSLGATLHRLLTRHDPAINAPNLSDFPNIRGLNPQITPQFGEIITRALALLPEDRWPSAGEMGRAIRALPPLDRFTSYARITAFQPAESPQVSRTISRPVTKQPNEIFITIHRLIDQGRFQDARKQLSKILDHNPADADAHKLMGLLYARMRPPDGQRALEEYQEALAIDSKDSEVHRLIGDVLLYILQTPHRAIEEYRKALHLQPNDYESIRLLGYAHESLQQYDMARTYYFEAIRAAPFYIPAHMSFGELSLRMDNLKDAEMAFIEALRINPSLPLARYLLTLVYERQGRLNDALREAEYSVQVDPDNANARDALKRIQRAVKTSRR